MRVAVIAIFGFLIGSIPFSLILSRRLSKADVRDYGDGNPGAANAWRSSGWRIGVAAGIMDFLKGGIPVVGALVLGISDWGLVPVSVAPVLGHAFSPFLKGKGGKAIASTFGIWTGLMMFRGTYMLGFCFLLPYMIIDSDSWSAVAGMSLFGLLLYVTGSPGFILVIWAINTAVITYKHIPDLKSGFALKHAKTARSGVRNG